MVIQVRRLSYALGAEVTGVDLREPLEADTVENIRRAWLENQVLVFPGQDVTPEQQLRFSAYFATLEEYPLVHYRLPGYPEIFLLSNRDSGGRPSETRNAARHWHSDLSFTDKPAMGSILRCIHIPDVGGTTMWANQTMAYDYLSPTFQNLIEPLTAVHELFSKTKDLKNLDQGKVRDMKKANPRVAQPVVRVHDETGRKALYVSVAVTTEIVGMQQEESDAILEFLFAHQTQPQFTYRHVWRPNDIVMWDNRCTLHQAVADNDHGQARIMHRTSLVGVPCGQIMPEDAKSAAMAMAMMA
ncbi:MAG: TauD/TfdA family dioxygenase [Betaproteobacteria bacterium]|nr:TauD/TfdA family dioxygenase [Betaproteobacteria bacterium]